MSNNEKTRKHIIYFRFTVLLLAPAIPVIFNIYSYYSGTDLAPSEFIRYSIGLTIYSLIPYIILIGISFRWKKIALLIGAGALMLTVEFLVNLDVHVYPSGGGQAGLIFLVLPIYQTIIILPIGMGLGFIASFLIKNYQTRKPMTTYQKNVLYFALIILVSFCFFIYLQKSDDVVVMSIVSLLQKEETWAQDWYIVANKSRNPEKKIKYYSSAIKFNPNFAAAYRARAGVKHHRFKDYKGAIQDYNKAIELAPKNEPVRQSNVLSPNAMAYKYRGDAKSELGDYRGAIEDYTKALRLILSGLMHTTVGELLKGN